MAKEFKCNECQISLGEMTKGKIKKDAIFYCGRCNYQLLLNKNDNKINPILDMFGDLFKGVKK